MKRGSGFDGNWKEGGKGVPDRPKPSPPLLELLQENEVKGFFTVQNVAGKKNAPKLESKS